MSHNESYESYKSHVKFIYYVSIPPCSMVRYAGEGKGGDETAFIDQRTVAAGNNICLGRRRSCFNDKLN